MQLVTTGRRGRRQHVQIHAVYCHDGNSKGNTRNSEDGTTMTDGVQLIKLLLLCNPIESAADYTKSIRYFLGTDT